MLIAINYRIAKTDHLVHRRHLFCADPAVAVQQIKELMIDLGFA